MSSCQSRDCDLSIIISIYWCGWQDCLAKSVSRIHLHFITEILTGTVDFSTDFNRKILTQNQIINGNKSWFTRNTHASCVLIPWTCQNVKCLNNNLLETPAMLILSKLIKYWVWSTTVGRVKADQTFTFLFSRFVSWWESEHLQAYTFDLSNRKSTLFTLKFPLKR